MTRHIFDQTHARNGASRLRQFIMLERRNTTPSVVQDLRQRRRVRHNVHLRKYLRIARGHLA
ncbi:hypothetical protein [Parasulfitobacter algicola]|uniref:Uncharacterized protein n=1 Tax=Parasulfitobacter algicola TaxID=2614809 RepID=A0ABX2IW69_9RHOB|nr:hypothetical protein [Sulfitobacter algicola]NSX54654.1 hypothetical protein [Sulfitobacter algicola]